LLEKPIIVADIVIIIEIVLAAVRGIVVTAVIKPMDLSSRTLHERGPFR